MERLTDAQARLVADHAYVARWVARAEGKRWPRQEYADLFSDAQLGLVDAAIKWCPDRATATFEKYAIWIARYRVRDGCRTRARTRSARRVRIDHLDHVMAYNTDGGPMTLVDVLPVEVIGTPAADADLIAYEEACDDHRVAARAVRSLCGRARDVAERLAAGEHMATVAADHGVSESRISQINAENVATMRLVSGIHTAPPVPKPPVVLDDPWTPKQLAEATRLWKLGRRWFTIALAVGHPVSECKEKLGVTGPTLEPT